MKDINPSIQQRELGVPPDLTANILVFPIKIYVSLLSEDK
jgi:hypothetical protein